MGKTRIRGGRGREVLVVRVLERPASSRRAIRAVLTTVTQMLSV